MMWFNKADSRAIFGDRRSETITVTARTHREDGTRTLVIEPNFLMDFRSPPFPNDTFWHVTFDPPHLERAGPRSWLAAKYGKLSQDWRDDDTEHKPPSRRLFRGQTGENHETD